MKNKLTESGGKPGRFPGEVQPFGFLIAVSADAWCVTRVSRNLPSWISAGPAGLIGQPLNRIFTSEAIHTIRRHLQLAMMGGTYARVAGLALTPAGQHCDLTIYEAGGAIVIECEPCGDQDASPDAGEIVRGMTARLQQTKDQHSFFRVAAREMRAATRFDRVMIHRFDQDGSGEVIAESARSGLESFVGLHYPASDFPLQARQRHERNWLRIFPEVEAMPCPIEPPLEDAGEPLDLSMSVLRSGSPAQIEYLRNMGVRAAMTMSILRGGRLWGVFVCHHGEPHHLSLAWRTIAELYGQMFSLLLESRERDRDAAREVRAEQLQQRLAEGKTRGATRPDAIIAHLDDLADLLSCDGIGVCTGGRATLRGLTPDESQFSDLIAFLNSKGICEVHARDEIGIDYAPARAFADRAAGMLVVPLSQPARDHVIFFRKEAAGCVPPIPGPASQPLTPQHSFSRWKQSMRGRSRPWLPIECRVAESLRVALLEIAPRLSDLRDSESSPSPEQQELLIAELNHRVRNILGLIRGVISQSKGSANSVEAFSKVVGDRVHALARAHDQITADDWGPASFRGLINAEAAAYLNGETERVVVTGADFQLEPTAITTVALVMHEMITNSAKYGALSDRHGRVEIATRVDQRGGLTIDWNEQGGPPVKPPSRRGFGSTVIERSIPFDLKGEAQVDFDEVGLRARFTIPAAYVRPPLARRRERAGANPESAVPIGLLPSHVLLVEDNMIIALDTEEMMRQLGVASVRIAGSVRDGLQALSERLPDFALLDVNLGGETSFDLAVRLAELKVPFAFATGYGEQIAFPAGFATTPRLRKPYTSDALRAIFG